MNSVLQSSPLIDKFKLRLEAVGGRFEHVSGKEEALALVLDLLRQEGVADTAEDAAVWADGSLLTAENKERLAAAVPGIRFDVTRAQVAKAKVGISQLEWGLANTGTLVQAADAVDTRLVSSLPMLHIALAPTAGVLPDLPAVLEKVHPEKAAYLAFITGPSRTSDIERVLTIGVHGPERLIVILVDELEVAL
ncbi:MAG: lactate utilization protein [Acidobacteriota bacterium]|nr:lactate utilization protein [Acidobacteriota bacterium]